MTVTSSIKIRIGSLRHEIGKQMTLYDLYENDFTLNTIHEMRNELNFLLSIIETINTPEYEDSKRNTNNRNSYRCCNSFILHNLPEIGKN